MQEVISQLPAEAWPLMTTLLDEPVMPESRLRGELRSHVEAIRAAAASNEFLDVSLALRLAEVCTGLIEAARERDASTRHLVQAAVRYFILDDDGEHDLESVCGLDDDAEVCNVVARSLGRDDLLTSL